MREFVVSASIFFRILVGIHHQKRFSLSLALCSRSVRPRGSQNVRSKHPLDITAAFDAFSTEIVRELQKARYSIELKEVASRGSSMSS
jgi:hypothetical protein